MPTPIKLFAVALIVLASIAIAHKVASAPLVGHEPTTSDPLEVGRFNEISWQITANGTALEPDKVFYVEPDALFERIAMCESRNDPKAKNPSSTAKGRFQFLNSSWQYYGQQYWGDKLPEKDVFDYEDNTALAWYVYMKNGTADWLESKHCWE